MEDVVGPPALLVKVVKLFAPVLLFEVFKRVSSVLSLCCCCCVVDNEDPDNSVVVLSSCCDEDGDLFALEFE